MSRLLAVLVIISFALLPLPNACGDNILDDSFGVKKVASDCRFTEGPALDEQGNLFFSDNPNDRIMKLSSDGKLSVHLRPCGRANGLLLDRQGRLLMCQSAGEGGKRAVARQEKDGAVTTLADSYDGRPFIAPNDLCLDPQGRVYFTDPWYGGDIEKTQPSSGVYRIDGPGQVTRVVSDLLRPNGIVITPDGKLVYISDRGTQKLHRYRTTEEGELIPDGVVYDFSPDRGIDGMWLDVKGNIYGAAGQGETTGLFVISPQGKLLLHKPMPEFSTNVVIGGPDGRDLYLTAGGSVYHMRTVTPSVRYEEDQ